MIPCSPEVGVAIATKNRWNDLEISLTNLRKQGLDSLETVVIDDGSTVPCPPGFAKQFPWVRFLRHEKSLGYMATRNELAQTLTTPFILQLDDDSFPVAGDLRSATAWLGKNPHVAALCFQILFQGETIPEDFEERRPFPIKDFVGCAAFFKRDLFLAQGGYESRLEFFGEEQEFSLRLFREGYEIHGYPAVVVQHNLTPVDRHRVRRARLYLRNEMLVPLWLYPFPKSLLRAMRCLPAILLKNPDMRPHFFSLLAGGFEAPLKYLSWKHDKKRLTPRQLKAWKELPLAVEVLNGIK
jgi:GT2 family glycosyltransferase